jgi:hypothetical protein
MVEHELLYFLRRIPYENSWFILHKFFVLLIIKITQVDRLVKAANDIFLISLITLFFDLLMFCSRQYSIESIIVICLSRPLMAITEK